MSRVLSTLIALTFLAITVPVSADGMQQGAACEDFDAWQWAQAVYEMDPDANAALDPDGDDIACPELPRNGFTPVLWTDRIPEAAQPARVSGITDGDTFRVIVDGTPDTIRMYHINAPELGSESHAQHCGAEEATDYLAFVLGLTPDQTVWLEYDETERDRYDRRLAYVWLELDGEIYLVNEVMVRNGWAESETYEPDTQYRDELNEAEQFSVRHDLGVRDLCGTFGVSIEPTPEQRLPSGGAGSGGNSAAPPPPASSGTTCDPSYPDVCIPPRAEVGDLDCGDISERRFTVIPPDPHNFDGDHDGIGCESG